MPATRTPYDSEITGITKSDDENIVKTIKLKFKKTGVIPDNMKRLYELNIPAHIAVRDMNNKYGNVTNSISDVKFSLVLSSAKPGANIQASSVEKYIPSDVIINNTKNRFPKIF